MEAIRRFARWVVRHLLSFVAIVAILVAINVARDEMNELARAISDSAHLTARYEILADQLKMEAEAARRRVGGLKPVENDLRARIAGIDEEMRQIALQRGALETISAILKGQTLDKAKAEARFAVLQHEKAFINSLLDFLVETRGLEGARAELERRRLVHVARYAELTANEQQQQSVKGQYWISSRVPGTNAYWQLHQLARQGHIFTQQNLDAWQAYQEQLQAVKQAGVPHPPRPFEVSAADIQAFLAPIGTDLSGLEREIRANWWSKVRQPVTKVLPLALGILAGVIAAPLLIKSFLYYIIAPLASRRRPITLLPDSGPGSTADQAPPSSVSLAVIIDQHQELLVHPEYLQSTADAASKGTKWLLDWSIPISSLSSGMVALTRVRSESSQTSVVSAMKEPLSELRLITIPAGSAMVLQPHNLAGLVQARDCPVRITRHWRLGSLVAWLTLQLRFLVFHGPVTLIVKGCRGVRIEQAQGGRSINQAATVGFTASLAYSVRRYETFMPYLLGKQELFNDNFSGEPGCLVYEESPNFGKKSGITGRGLEGILDAFLKVFGI